MSDEDDIDFEAMTREKLIEVARTLTRFYREINAEEQKLREARRRMRKSKAAAEQARAEYYAANPFCDPRNN
jgi:hypothetical protein